MKKKYYERRKKKLSLVILLKPSSSFEFINIKLVPRREYRSVLTARFLLLTCNNNDNNMFFVNVSTRRGRYIWVRRDRTVFWSVTRNIKTNQEIKKPFELEGHNRQGECLPVGVHQVPTISRKEKVITVCRCAPPVERWMEQEEEVSQTAKK